jgi:menaquinone-dependent protoporphyrinogen oxidase
MAKTLVAFATKHGSTAEIAETIGMGLRAGGREVDVRPAGEVTDLSAYDAVVVGSAVYMGSWQRDALDFLRRHETELAQIPTWMYSSGPTGGSPEADAKVAALAGGSLEVAPPKAVAKWAKRIGARGHMTLPGRITESMGGIFARWMPRGDWRDLATIRNWGLSLAAER